jgi:hypothetical protein
MQEESDSSPNMCMYISSQLPEVESDSSSSLSQLIELTEEEEEE